MLDDRKHLEEVIVGRGVPRRDCRSCAQYQPDEQGRAFGWCRAHSQYVKLYHEPEAWHSQCQFKNLRIVRELDRS